jgi:hypothetical protein
MKRLVLAIACSMGLAGSAQADDMTHVPKQAGWCARVEDGSCQEYVVDDAPDLRIVHYGFEDGMRFDLYRRRGAHYRHLFSFEPVQAVEGQPGRYARVDDLHALRPVLAHDRLQASFEWTLEEDMGESRPEHWQKRVPAILFTGEPRDADEVREALAMQFAPSTAESVRRQARRPRTACPTSMDELVRTCP